MKRFLVFVSAAALLFAAAQPASAAFLTYYSGLRTEVNNRITTLSGLSNPTAQQKTDLKNLGKILKTLDKASSTLAGDLNNLSSAAGGIASGFPSDTTLGGLVGNAVNSYANYCQGQLDTVANQINALPASTAKDAANTARLAAQAIVDAAKNAASPVAGATALNGFPKALSTVQKAYAKAQSSSGGGGGGGGGGSGGNSITANFGGHNFKPTIPLPNQPGAIGTFGNGTLVIQCVEAGTTTYGLQLGVTGIAAPGTFPMADGDRSAHWTITDVLHNPQNPQIWDTYTPTSGTLTVTNIDTTNKKVTGSFDFMLQLRGGTQTMRATGNFTVLYP